MKGGYTDLRQESASGESFYVSCGEIERHLCFERQGRMYRAAGSYAFDMSTSRSDLTAKDSPFSRYILDTWEKQSNQEVVLTERKTDDAIVPADLREAAIHLADENVQFRFTWEERETFFANSIGIERTRLNRFHVVRVDIAEYSNKNTIHLRTFFHSPTAFKLGEYVKSTSELRTELRHGVKFRPGLYDIVLHPTVSAVFAHEVYGHTGELDRAAPQPADGNHTAFASPCVTVEDVPEYKNQIGHLTFDDDGLVPRTITLIENGQRRDQLVSLEQGFHYGLPANGRARARDVRYRPLTRMTNLRLKEGSVEPKELLANLNHGVYLVGTLGAVLSVDHFRIQCQYGYIVNRGKLSGLILKPVLSGDIHAARLAVSAVASDFNWIEDGGCFLADQFIHASGRGAPHTLLTNMNIS